MSRENLNASQHQCNRLIPHAAADAGLKELHNYEIVYFPDTGAEPRKMVLAADKPLSPEQAFGLLRQIRRDPNTGEVLQIRKVLSVEAVLAPEPAVIV
jgi:hypothetical protein